MDSTSRSATATCLSLACSIPAFTPNCPPVPPLNLQLISSDGSKGPVLLLLQRPDRLHGTARADPPKPNSRRTAERLGTPFPQAWSHAQIHAHSRRRRLSNRRLQTEGRRRSVSLSPRSGRLNRNPVGIALFIDPSLSRHIVTTSRLAPDRGSPESQ